MMPDINKSLRECSRICVSSIELTEMIPHPIFKFILTNFSIFVHENYFKIISRSTEQDSFIFPNTLASEDLYILCAYQDNY